MTLLVGIRCQDGVVIAADQAVTFGTGQVHTISHRAPKITVLHNSVIVAGTGQVGMKQRLVEKVDQLWGVAPGKDGCIKVGKTAVQVTSHIAAVMRNDFAETKAQMGAFGALVAFPNKSGPQLCEFATSDFQPELKDDGTWYVSMGSGQSLADPYLAFMRHVYWQDGRPTLEHALFAAAWVMTMSITVAPGYVAEPIDIAVLAEQKGTWKASQLTPEEVQVQLDAARAATEHFGKFDPKKIATGEENPEGPAPPPPIPEPEKK